ncbi:NAD(P)/FAD-dependent oxidoreductase [Shinella pollutisoli]|uniref:NAD(P)/FAD-dependent oxidoreductase n=1 Tax=Shinella pollutisoli TaxID=2250594 RepID=A0ABV7DGW5_9HYPH|nr:FAD-binding oxidoreductase [Shinella pollutisoli]
MNQPSLTHERELRRSRPLWLDSPRISVRTRTHPSLSRYDAVVVGAGISGALVAHALAGVGRSVLIVDRRPPVRGSSIASTAMIQHEIDVPLTRLGRMIGRERAARAWQRSAGAVLRLEETVNTLGLSCGFRRKGALYLAGDEMGARALKAEAKAREAAGIGARFLDAATLRETYGLDRTGAIESGISASANPGQLTAGLLRDLQRRGVEIVAGTEITDLRSLSEEVVMATGEGRLIGAGHAIFCTGYEFLKRLADKRHRIISTWALASRPGLAVPGWLKDRLVWEASDPYLYLRVDAAGRLVAGGEDEEDEEAFRSAGKLVTHTDAIRRKVEALIGVKLGAPAYRWAAAFGATATGLPLIGPVPGLANVHAVMGFGGNGITFSQIAAEIVSAAVNGTRDPDADLFAFD